jgi:hypothetical protein
VWKIHNYLHIRDGYTEHVNFTCNGVKYVGIKSQADCLYYCTNISVEGDGYGPAVADGSQGFDDETYQIVDFGDTPQTVSESLFWIIAHNATYQGVQYSDLINGKSISIQMGKCYDSEAIITNVGDGFLTYRGELGFDSLVKLGLDTSASDYTIRVSGVPEFGDIDFGECSFAYGDRALATAPHTFAVGKDIQANHAYATTIGQQLVSGKDHQVVVGYNNIVDHTASFIVAFDGNLFTVGADDTGNYLTLGNDKLYEGTIATKEYVDELVSGIDTMLDEVIDSQNSYIGGETE